MDKVSVVIPCYNADRFLQETVESVLVQDYPDIEILLVDDGSTDGTAKLIRSFGSKVRAEFGPNRGPSAARNRGTALATGSFIQYLDADDLLLPGAEKRRVDALAASGADVAYSDWQRLEEQSDGIFSPCDVVSRTIEDVHPDPEIAIFSDFWAPPAALLYRRSIVERIGSWNESLPVIQDARFLLDAALRGARFVHVSEVGAYYRVHQGPSVSRKDPVCFIRDCLRNATQVEEWFCAHGGLTPDRRRAVQRAYEFVARGSFEHDVEIFDQACAALERIQPGYCPDRGFALPLLSRLFGYRRAEGIALQYRRLKRLMSHGVSRSSLL
jgi:glycosyltransferase involved in cell wall biosynthesis